MNLLLKTRIKLSKWNEKGPTSSLPYKENQASFLCGVCIGIPGVMLQIPPFLNLFCSCFLHWLQWRLLFSAFGPIRLQPTKSSVALMKGTDWMIDRLWKHDLFTYRAYKNDAPAFFFMPHSFTQCSQFQKVQLSRANILARRIASQEVPSTTSTGSEILCGLRLFFIELLWIVISKYSM